MEDRQSRRIFSWNYVGSLLLVVVWGGAGLFLYLYNRLDVLAWIVVESVISTTVVGVAATVVCRVIVNSHRRTQEVVLSGNVVPMRRRPREDDTQVLPVVVGRAAPVAGGGPKQPRRPSLAYTAGDRTIDVWLRDTYQDEGSTG